ncbi:hypothetical protein [Paraburkholderia sp. 32]|uniref:hypothetical protein n=1 Tax=Paraburkholderia sp. 32 TaxID=2991057 RepID=UPI003D1BAC88
MRVVIGFFVGTVGAVGPAHLQRADQRIFGRRPFVPPAHELVAAIRGVQVVHFAQIRAVIRDHRQEARQQGVVRRLLVVDSRELFGQMSRRPFDRVVLVVPVLVPPRDEAEPFAEAVQVERCLQVGPLVPDQQQKARQQRQRALLSGLRAEQAVGQRRDDPVKRRILVLPVFDPPRQALQTPGEGVERAELLQILALVMQQPQEARHRQPVGVRAPFGLEDQCGCGGRHPFALAFFGEMRRRPFDRVVLAVPVLFPPRNEREPLAEAAQVERRLQVGPLVPDQRQKARQQRQRALLAGFHPEQGVGQRRDAPVNRRILVLPVLDPPRQALQAPGEAVERAELLQVPALTVQHPQEARHR